MQPHCIDVTSCVDVTSNVVCHFVSSKLGPTQGWRDGKWKRQWSRYRSVRQFPFWTEDWTRPRTLWPTRSQPSRSRSCPGGAKNLDIYEVAQCSCILLPFFALGLSRGLRWPMSIKIPKRLTERPWTKFSFWLLSHYYHCIATPTTSRHSYFRRNTARGQFYLSRTE